MNSDYSFHRSTQRGFVACLRKHCKPIFFSGFQHLVCSVFSYFRLDVKTYPSPLFLPLDLSRKEQKQEKRSSTYVPSFVQIELFIIVSLSIFVFIVAFDNHLCLRHYESRCSSSFSFYFSLPEYYMQQKTTILFAFLSFENCSTLVLYFLPWITIPSASLAVLAGLPKVQFSINSNCVSNLYQVYSCNPLISVFKGLLKLYSAQLCSMCNPNVYAPAYALDLALD